MELFDHEQINHYERDDSIFGILLFSRSINRDFANYFDVAVHDLSFFTGNKLNVFYLKAAEQVPAYQLPEHTLHKFTPIGSAQNVKEKGYFSEAQLLSALGDRFLEGELWQMPCIIFFRSFHSKDFYLFKLNQLPPEDAFKILMKLSADAEEVYRVEESAVGNIQLEERRMRAFRSFEVSLNRAYFGQKAKRIVGNSTMLAIFGAAVGFI